MFPLEKHYVEMCNWAHEATDREKLLRKLSDEQLRELQGLVRIETSAGHGGPILALQLITAVLDDEIATRKLGARQ